MTYYNLYWYYRSNPTVHHDRTIAKDDDDLSRSEVVNTWHNHIGTPSTNDEMNDDGNTMRLISCTEISEDGYVMIKLFEYEG